MKKVFVNGYGSIGSRIIQFIKDDPEIEVIGIGKYSPDSKVHEALNLGYNIYVPEKNQNAFLVLVLILNIFLNYCWYKTIFDFDFFMILF